jgi:hypothetical protein
VRLVTDAAQHEADEHRAGVAHEDAGRVEVVRQEAQAGAGQHRGDERRRADAPARRRGHDAVDSE